MKKMRKEKTVVVESSSHNSTKKRKLRDRFSRFGNFLSGAGRFRNPAKASATKAAVYQQDENPREPESPMIDQDNFPLGTYWC